MITQIESFGKAEIAFRAMLDFVKDAIDSGEYRIDQVERQLFDQLLKLGKHMLEAYVEGAGDGDHGEMVEHQGEVVFRSEDKHCKLYRSIFGVLEVHRYVYAPGAKKKVAWRPVDQWLGLPEGEQSYVLEDWLQRVCVKESYKEGVTSLRDLLGVTTSVRAAEVMNRRMAQYSEGFSETTGTGRVQDNKIVVLSADGKGVPMRRPLEARLKEHQTAHPDQTGSGKGATEGVEATADIEKKSVKKRLKRGEKRTRKQMAYVGVVYNIDPFVRTAEEVVDELRRKQRQVNRPRPEGKQVFAEMTQFHEDEVYLGQVQCFARLASAAIDRCGPDTRLVCLMDGQKSLWNLKESWFSRAVGVMDIFHVLERLWQVAHVFHGEGPKASSQVDQHLHLLLQGKVSHVIGLYKRMSRKHHLTGSNATTVRETINYFTNNKQYMKYDEYLAAGYPIGTGVVEGACGHFVKDRMELAGIRWEIEGAQPMLSLRAFYLNEQWDEFIEYRIQTEQDALYGQAA